MLISMGNGVKSEYILRLDSIYMEYSIYSIYMEYMEFNLIKKKPWVFICNGSPDLLIG